MSAESKYASQPYSSANRNYYNRSNNSNNSNFNSRLGQPTSRSQSSPSNNHSSLQIPAPVQQPLTFSQQSIVPRSNTATLSGDIKRISNSNTQTPTRNPYTPTHANAPEAHKIVFAPPSAQCIGTPTSTQQLKDAIIPSLNHQQQSADRERSEHAKRTTASCSQLLTNGRSSNNQQCTASDSRQRVPVSNNSSYQTLSNRTPSNQQLRSNTSNQQQFASLPPIFNQFTTMPTTSKTLSQPVAQPAPQEIPTQASSTLTKPQPSPIASPPTTPSPKGHGKRFRNTGLSPSGEGNPEKWGHYFNLHKALAEFLSPSVSTDVPGDSCVFFEQKVCITEKLDGSNLGVHVSRHANGKWKIVALQGRNSTLWTEGSPKDITKLVPYGNAGKLEDMPLRMANFAGRLGDDLQVDEIAVFGEAYREQKESRFISWHPFGYKLPKQDWKLYRLTSITHALLQKASGRKALTSHAESRACIRSQTDHMIVPPAILFCGFLSDAIVHLKHAMTHGASDVFEGCFVVTEDGTRGFKWKTGLFEEQQTIPRVSALRLATPRCKELYSHLVDVYYHGGKRGPRPSDDLNDPVIVHVELAPMELSGILARDVKTAYDRELTKRNSFAQFPHKHRSKVISDITKATVKEIIQQYQESSIPCPYADEDTLYEKARLMVKEFVMSVEYIPRMDQA